MQEAGWLLATRFLRRARLAFFDNLICLPVSRPAAGKSATADREALAGRQLSIVAWGAECEFIAGNLVRNWCGIRGKVWGKKGLD
jgi:hypothetical protein